MARPGQQDLSLHSKPPVEAIRRAREFYRYLEPHDVDHRRFQRRNSIFSDHQNHLPKLSSSLTPYCQLVALRCNVPKVMLSFIDRETMYILAEAYQDKATSQLSSSFEFREDPILSSCSSMPSKDRVCEMTIALNPITPDGRIPTFQIPDMRASRFAAVPVVSGPPYYRFYAGAPITTRDNINIGSLSVMDTEVREGLSPQEEAFLCETARQIMNHLETNREAIEGRRSRRMAQCMDAFIAGRNTLEEHKERNRRSGTSQASSRRVRRLSNQVGKATGEGLVGERGDRRSLSVSEDGTSSDSTLGSITQRGKSDTRSHGKTFARAANLLREAFGELGNDGTVVFLNAKNSTGQRSSPISPQATVKSSEFKSPEGGSHESPEDAHDNGQIAPILALSSSYTHFQADGSSSSSCSISEDMLKTLIRRYPGGTVWSFDDWRSSSSEDDDHNSQSQHAKSGSQRRKFEKKTLQAAFPDARQLLFAPIWSPSMGTFAHAVFVTVTLEIRSLSSKTDLSFINSFCSTLMAECSRIDTVLADKQKDDFVGTISHEMRSPLHGILASTEFLTDTELTGFQQTLVETVRSCGQTLLDTINHVLDYSKINTFQKQWQSTNKKGIHKLVRKTHNEVDAIPKTFAAGAPPLLQLFGLTSISVVLEEVVDGLMLGNTYFSGVDITDVSQKVRKGGTDRRRHANSDLSDSELAVYVDIQQADWTFLTQPGAIRRIIQNLVGNALKYCKRGHIRVKLELADKASSAADQETVLLTVEDTGCGISQEFLSSRLFLPFAQENSLAPGTGLGLSIVHSIVTMLGGTIEVNSTIGEGTTIQVHLPLKRSLQGQQSTMTAPHSGTTSSGTSLGDEAILSLQQISVDSAIVIFRPRLLSKQDLLAQILSRYVEGWYGMRLLEKGELHSAQVIIVEEDDLDALLTEWDSSTGCRPAMIVLCSVISRHSASYVAKLQDRIDGPVEFVSKPCGPYKLAKSVRLALQRLGELSLSAQVASEVDTLHEEKPAELPGILHDDATPTVDSTLMGLSDLDLNGPDTSSPVQVVYATETFAASQISEQAQMAINDPSSDQQQLGVETDMEEFPFPDQLPPEKPKMLNQQRNPFGSPATPPETPAQEIIPDQIDTVIRQSSAALSPRILVVDDNAINLKLLETFLRVKRKYTSIICVEDGQKAVDAVVTATQPFHIIFMDISMPVMNGFEATRAIREFEDKNPGVPGSMIIALTGLASGRDQAEGFESGCDLYLTKPVSFKEVGKLLTNWETHQNLKS